MAVSSKFANQELVVSNSKTSLRIHREVVAGRLRRLAQRLYTSNITDPPEDIVRRHMLDILAAIYPGCVICDRSAATPTWVVEGSVFLCLPKEARDLALPGLTVRPRVGAAAFSSDIPLGVSGVFLASATRTLLENLHPSRGRAAIRRRLTQGELEEYLDRLLRVRGRSALESLAIPWSRRPRRSDTRRRPSEPSPSPVTFSGLMKLDRRVRHRPRGGGECHTTRCDWPGSSGSRRRSESGRRFPCRSLPAAKTNFPFSSRTFRTISRARSLGWMRQEPLCKPARSPPLDRLVHVASAFLYTRAAELGLRPIDVATLSASFGFDEASSRCNQRRRGYGRRVLGAGVDLRAGLGWT